MSLAFRRGISTLIPPKIASPSIGAAKDASRMANVVKFYTGLPKGPAPEVKPTGPFERYQARYFGKNPSGMPIVHVIGFLIAIGYGQAYYFHLRHHKNNAH
ncbi:putative mitochondrial F1F0 ATP synthase subunit F [Tuber borchii]|uniref:Putative mitochondrial F1F0 ATP synthase subunit F n=1 Tax=Tuber borchii TaxID=42251 RepID=A0A2T6ZXH3_TUBBO|nr:putative mitochondrial F1F0 ATP synthase subunit F [Tuber borchii]